MGIFAVRTKGQHNRRTFARAADAAAAARESCFARCSNCHLPNLRSLRRQRLCAGVSGAAAEPTNTPRKQGRLQEDSSSRRRLKISTAPVAGGDAISPDHHSALVDSEPSSAGCQYSLLPHSAELHEGYRYV